MKYLILLILVALISSCESESEVNDTNTKEKVEDSLVLETAIDTTFIEQKDTIVMPNYELTDADKKSLKSYLTKNQILALSNELNTFNTSEIDTVIINSFIEILRITDTLKNHLIATADYEMIDENDDYYPFNLQTELAGLEKAIPGFINSCVAECTEYDCHYQLAPFISRSKLTIGIADDEFFELLTTSSGDYFTTAHQFRAWFAQMWDYGGASLLGSDIHLDYLKNSQDFITRYSNGNKLLKRLQNEAYGDALHGIYMNHSIKVGKELKAIMDLKIYTSEENAKLNELYMKIISGDYTKGDGVGRKLQFDCETGDCDFGG